MKRSITATILLAALLTCGCKTKQKVTSAIDVTELEQSALMADSSAQSVQGALQEQSAQTSTEIERDSTVERFRELTVIGSDGQVLHHEAEHTTEGHRGRARPGQATASRAASQTATREVRHTAALAGRTRRTESREKRTSAKTVTSNLWARLLLLGCLAVLILTIKKKNR